MAASLSSSLFLPKLPSLSANLHPKRSLISLPPLSASASPFRNQTSAETDLPVPFEQQPVNEYQSLVSSPPFSWAASDLSLYISRLAITTAAFALFISLPVLALRNGDAGDPRDDVIHLMLGATSAALLAVTLAAVRIYIEWVYVGNRLLSATVEYEETGWNDGQIWVKTPEVLARDRLLGSFTVKPILNRLKLTLAGLVVSLVLFVLVFINTENPEDLSENVNGRVIAGKYSDESARSLEPNAFCGETELYLFPFNPIIM